MFAVVQSGGKQYVAEPGKMLLVEKLEAPVGSVVELNEVLLVDDGAGSSLVGLPIVEGAAVLAEVLEHVVADKVIVFKKKLRTNYRRKIGHKQQHTRVKVLEIKKQA